MEGSFKYTVTNGNWTLLTYTVTGNAGVDASSVPLFVDVNV